jgi:dephospho-CoA kinase
VARIWNEAIGSLTLLVGQTCSGKTTISNLLERNGFSILSASKALATVGRRRGEDVSSRTALSTIGLKLRRTNELVQFHEELFSNWNNQAAYLVDGPRFVETYYHAKILHPSPTLVYLHCSDEVRRKRFERTHEALSWAAVNSIETESSVLDFVSLADEVIDSNEFGPHRIAEQIVKRIKLS